MKKHFTTILLFVVLIAGLSLILYPTVSDYWNSLVQTRAVTTYTEVVNTLEREEYDRLLQEAADYNSDLRGFPDPWNPTAEQHERYTSILDVTGSGVMSKLEIPAINLSLPIYHTTEENVLQVAVGHVEGSSLPVGGEGTHCVLSGHRGLPSARLFTDLDRLAVGDVFTLCTLKEVLTYEVDQIRIVMPQETRDIQLVPGEDYCTLVTCTPYGVNTHRILVRGHRIENLEDAKFVRITSDAVQVDPLLVAPVVAVPLLLVLLIWFLTEDNWRAERKKKTPKGEQK